MPTSEEGPAGHEAKRVAGVQEFFPEPVVAARHHLPVGRDPLVKVLQAVTDGLLGDPRLADRHGVLGLEGMVDEFFGGNEGAFAG